MAPSEMAVMFRAALRYINGLSGNVNFYDDQTGASYHLAQTLIDLDAAYPEPWTAYEKALLQVFSNNGLDNGEYFLRLLRGHGIGTDAFNNALDRMDNGYTLYDHMVTFDKGIAFGEGLK